MFLKIIAIKQSFFIRIYYIIFVPIIFEYFDLYTLMLAVKREHTSIFHETYFMIRAINISNDKLGLVLKAVVWDGLIENYKF